MLTYHQVLTADLGLLTTAAEQWDAAAKKFDSVLKTYDSDVKSITTDGSWSGQAHIVAQPSMQQTHTELASAAKEARAIASLLRDAHTHFTELRGKLKAAVAEAEKADMKIDDQGRATATVRNDPAATHDPDYRAQSAKIAEAEASWTRHIAEFVQAFDDADQGVKLALTAAVQDTTPLDGLGGFNANAEGDIEKVEVREATNLADKLRSGKHLSTQELNEMQWLLRDVGHDEQSSRTFLDNIGPDGTIELANKLNGLAYDSDKGHQRTYLNIESGIAGTIATATADPRSSFYGKWREGLRSAGEKNFGKKTDPLYGYQTFVGLMEQGKGRYSGTFLNDLGDDIIATEKKHEGIWTQWTAPRAGVASDPLDHLLGVMSRTPDAATSFLDPGTDGKNGHLKYLLKEREWPRIALNGPGALMFMDDPTSKAGLGAALEAAATGHEPGTKHTLGGHTEAQARVMHDTIRVLNSDGHGDKLPANLRSPLGNMLADYTGDTHQILSRTREDYKVSGAEGKVWEDGGVVHMAVGKDDLVRVMRGVADDPAAFARMYNAERQYAADTLSRVPFNGDPDTRAAVIEAASSAYGFYDGISSDVVFDKRDKAIQWARDVSHAVTGTSGALLNFIPADVAEGVPMPKGVKVGADALNRITDFTMYEWTKEQISEASAAAGAENRAKFNHGQRQVDSLVVEWGRVNGHDPNEGVIRHLVGSGQERHNSARDEAFISLDREK
ncbi:hypothetical protein [Streptomyces sp. NPDC049555]|uniref:hypothetical protein n=1 Tax=Streptomyces sp. NPDC049555 TaxID=3154930 RepID=UPI003412FE58